MTREQVILTFVVAAIASLYYMIVSVVCIFFLSLRFGAISLLGSALLTISFFTRALQLLFAHLAMDHLLPYFSAIDDPYAVSGIVMVQYCVYFFYYC